MWNGGIADQNDRGKGLEHRGCAAAMNKELPLPGDRPAAPPLAAALPPRARKRLGRSLAPPFPIRVNSRSFAVQVFGSCPPSSVFIRGSNLLRGFLRASALWGRIWFA